MSAQTTKSEYILLFRGNDWHKGLSPEEMEKVAGQWMAWFNRLKDEGTAIAGNPLEPEGKIVSGKNRVVSDGPFAESKELVGGFWLFKCKSKQEAIEWVKRAPFQDHEMEIREVLEDFRESFTRALRKQEARLRETVEAH